jgi:hypothetical protein
MLGTLWNACSAGAKENLTHMALPNDILVSHCAHCERQVTFISLRSKVKTIAAADDDDAHSGQAESFKHFFDRNF